LLEGIVACSPFLRAWLKHEIESLVVGLVACSEDLEFLAVINAIQILSLFDSLKHGLVAFGWLVK